MLTCSGTGLMRRCMCTKCTACHALPCLPTGEDQAGSHRAKCVNGQLSAAFRGAPKAATVVLAVSKPCQASCHKEPCDHSMQ